MSSKNLKLVVGGKPIELSQSNYKGAGGEGTIYVKNGRAYKIYLDPAKMIPEGKIKELARLKLHNVLGPEEVVKTPKGDPVGFVMPYVDNTEYLVRLFTKGFRDQNGIDPAMINALVKRMQDTLKTIHLSNTLVVDYNEMNFLVSKAFDEVYHIDVDSYQTPSYPATAIMPSIRDRKVVNNKFTELSDWFSFGVVAFQLYMGTHPYKGRNPDFGKDWLAMMDAGVSVFNKKTRMPPNVQSWDVIPKGHLRWFEAIFEKGDRLPPPEPEHVTAQVGAVTAKIIASTNKFVLNLLQQYDSNIHSIRYIDGNRYAYTQKSVYCEKGIRESHAPLSGSVSKRTQYDFIPAQGAEPIKLSYNKLTREMTWDSFDKYVGYRNKGMIEGYFIANDCLYLVCGGTLQEIRFMNLGAKTLDTNDSIANIFMNSYVTLDGCVVQDILGTCRVTIPYKRGTAPTIRIPELDRVRIVDGKYMKGFAIFIGQSEGGYTRYTLVFNKNHTSYTLRKEEGVAIQDVNFTVMDKGVCVAANGDTVEIFADNNQVKVVPDSPLTDSQKLLTFGNSILVQHNDSLYQLSLK